MRCVGLRATLKKQTLLNGNKSIIEFANRALAGVKVTQHTKVCAA